jgi:hypothetical protein
MVKNFTALRLAMMRWLRERYYEEEKINDGRK